MIPLSNGILCGTVHVICNEKWRNLLPILVGAGLMLAAAGCEQPKVANRRPVVPVRGAALFKGKPAAGAILSFHPLNDVGPMTARPRSTVGSDGVFELTTYATNDGAPKGEYIITIYWPDPSKRPLNEDEDQDELPPDLLNGRFAVKGKSVLRARIGDNPVEFAPIDLGATEVTKSEEFYLREK